MLELAKRLIQKREQIIEEWMREVHEDLHIETSERLSRNGLMDHLPKILDSVAMLLREEGGDVDNADCEDAKRHGIHRWEQGYKLEEVLRELMLFRVVLIRQIIAFQKEQGALSPEVHGMVMERVHRLLDELGWNSTQQFVQEQQASLKKATDARTRLIRNVSHELRNVLNGLGLAAQLIEDDQVESIPEMRETLWRNVDHMKELLDDMLDLSALASGQQAVRPSTFAAVGLVKHVEAVYRPMAEEKGLCFEGEMDPALDAIVGDERKIEQVIANLVSNAIKYTETGSVRLSIHAVDADRWSFAVTDTGVGISEEDQKEIFSEFYRVEKTSHARGVGLGLAITVRLVELLKGELRLSSTYGEGSRFEVVLPRVYGDAGSESR
jgi:signal transduction histidine kinase